LKLTPFARGSAFCIEALGYLERDLRQLLNVSNLRDFERFIRVLAARNAGELDLTALGNGVGISSKTAAAWLSVLEASNQISLLEPWHANVGKRIVKRPKVYFRDSGLLCWLLGVSPPLPPDGPWNGALWETFVFAEMRKAIAASGKNRTLYYYRDNRGTEVDFVIVGEGTRLVEAKWAETAGNADSAGIARLSASGAKTGAPELAAPRGYVLCRTPFDHLLPQGEAGPAVEAVGIRGLARILDLSRPPDVMHSD